MLTERNIIMATILFLIFRLSVNSTVIHVICHHCQCQLVKSKKETINENKNNHRPPPSGKSVQFSNEIFVQPTKPLTMNA